MTTVSTPAPALRRRVSGYGVGLTAVLVLSILLGVWGDSRNGYRDPYYDAAVLSATKSWRAFFFGSVDTNLFITVDKPPLDLWVMALSARLFGFGTASVLIPQALATTGAVAALAAAVRLAFGRVAALLAALVLALTPAMVVVAHANHPDALLVLPMMLAAWGCAAAIRSGRTWPLLAAGLALGLGFDTKLMAALIPLPALALAYLWAGPRPLRTRVLQVLGAGGTLLAVSAAWLVAVQLTPAGSRPYVGSTTNNSELSLVFDYNGLGRILGVSTTQPPGAGNGSLGTKAGLGRLFEADVAGQISWLLPFAAVVLVAGLWLTRATPRLDPARAGYLMWGSWLVLHFVVLSFAKGQWHAYYTVGMAPAVAALTGAGLVALVRQPDRTARFVLAGGLFATAAWDFALLRRTPDYLPWLPGLVAGTAVLTVAVLGLAVVRADLRVRLVAGAAGVGLAVMLAGPAAYAMTTVEQRRPLGLMQGGPLVPAVLPPGIVKTLAGASKQESGPDPKLVAYLVAHRGGTRWLAAASNAFTATPYIVATGQPVMAMGGYLGSDPPPTVAQLRRLIAGGDLRFVVLTNYAAYTGGQGNGQSGSQGNGQSNSQSSGQSAFNKQLADYLGEAAAARDIWVRSHCKLVDASAYGGNRYGVDVLYDCAGRA
jgi:4-amino-4-deoxy-L-arabinose transferase-like glycosyltransferase